MTTSPVRAQTPISPVWPLVAPFLAFLWVREREPCLGRGVSLPLLLSPVLSVPTFHTLQIHKQGPIITLGLGKPGRAALGVSSRMT